MTSIEKKLLFSHIRNNNFFELEKHIDNHPDSDYNIRDENGLYLIFYITQQNNKTLLEKLLKTNIRIDIYDLEGKSILYVPIKFGYNDMIKQIMEYNKINVGIPIQTIEDNDGHLPINYAITFQNITAFNLLFPITSLTITDIDGNSLLHHAVSVRNLQLTKEVFSKMNDPNLQNNVGETSLHIACRNSHYEIVQFLLENHCNVNIQESEKLLTALHYACFNRNIKIISLLLDNDANVNIQDYNGNTPLHYAILNDRLDIISILLGHPKTKSITNVNLFDTNLNVPLISVFINNKRGMSDYISLLLDDTDINFQNRDGNTCLHYLCMDGHWKNFIHKLVKKKNDIFVQNTFGERPIDFISKEDYDVFMNMITDSYIYRLSLRKGTWSNDWENKCFDDKNICMKHIQDKFIKLEKSKIYDCHNTSYPVRKNSERCLDIKFDERVSFNTFSGFSLDILCGMIYVNKKHKQLKTILEKIDYDDNTTYNFLIKHGISTYEFLFKKNFVLWYKNSLYIMDGTKELFLDVIKNNKKTGYTHIMLYAILYLKHGLHANILLYTIKTNELERFDPFGSGFDQLLDDQLKSHFEHLIPNLKYISPFDYMTSTGIQKIDVTENLNAYIGDPVGYCAAWSIWYVDMRMTYPQISRNKLILYIAQQINVKHVKFRSVIRNYSKNITDIRDKILIKNGLDINQYINNDFNTTTLKSIINDLNKLIN